MNEPLVVNLLFTVGCMEGAHETHDNEDPRDSMGNNKRGHLTRRKLLAMHEFNTAIIILSGVLRTTMNISPSDRCCAVVVRSNHAGLMLQRQELYYPGIRSF